MLFRSDNLKNADMIDAIVLGHTHKKIEEQFYKDILKAQPTKNHCFFSFDTSSLIFIFRPLFEK